MNIMKILVTGATGTVGSELVKALLQRGAAVRALTRKQPKPDAFPDAVEIALGDLTDPVSIAEATKAAAISLTEEGHNGKTYTWFRQRC